MAFEAKAVIPVEISNLTLLASKFNETCNNQALWENLNLLSEDRVRAQLLTSSDWLNTKMLGQSNASSSLVI